MTRHPIWLIARRELTTRMLTKSNIISLAVMLAIIVGGSIALDYFTGRDSGPTERAVALDASVGALEEHLQAAAAQQDVELDVSTASAEDAEAALTADGDARVHAYLSGEPAAPEVLVRERADDTVMSLVGAAVQSYVVTEQISGLGGDPAAFEQALAGAAPAVQSLEEPGSGMNGPAYGISMVMISLLMFTLIGTGTVIAMGVVEEKTSRIVEILLATIRPAQLLAGKILGIGMFGLFQVAVLGGALAVMLNVLGLTEGLEVNVTSALAMLIAWFLIGYAIFSLLFGGFAALVSRQEEIGSVTTPLMFLLFIPFYTTMFMVPSDPDGSAVRVLSMIPVFSPFMVPVREAFGQIEPWEIALSMGIALVTIPVLVWVAGRVYQRGVLHTGGRMKLGDALRG